MFKYLSRYLIACILLLRASTAIAIVGGTGNGTGNLYVAGSYGYLGKVNQSNSLDTVLYPKVDFMGVAYGNGVFLAVGKNGQLLAMSNNNIWQTVPSFQISNYNSVKFIGNGFIAVGDNGLVSSSSDGKSWSSVLLPVNYKLQDVGGISSNYIAVGGSGLIYNISSKMKILSPTQNNLNSIAANGGNTLVAVGNSGTVIYSTDEGVSWSTATVNSNVNLYSVKFINGRFVAVGEAGTLLTSIDGKNWDIITINSNLKLQDIAYDSSSGNYIVIGFDGKYSQILTSSGLSSSWKYYQGITTTYLINKVECGMGICNIIGNRGMNLLSVDGEKNWKILKANTTEYTLSAVDQNAGTIVAAGLGGAILTSNDAGTTWNAVSAGYKNYDFTSLKFLNGAFYGTTTNGNIFMSVNGLSWAIINTGITSSLNDIAYKSNATSTQYPWIAVGDQGIVLASTDGIHWLNNSSGSPSVKLTQVNYSNSTSLFYISGAGGLIMTTNNLKSLNSFAKLNSGTTNNLRKITLAKLIYGNNYIFSTLLAVGESGTVLFAQGTTYTPVFSKLNCGLVGVVYGVQVLNGSAYIIGQLGSMSKLTLDANRNPICAEVNSGTDLSLIGISSNN